MYDTLSINYMDTSIQHFIKLLKKANKFCYSCFFGCFNFNKSHSFMDVRRKINKYQSNAEYGKFASHKEEQMIKGTRQLLHTNRSSLYFSLSSC